ncbi:unnamed protein product [Spirodela intermedia]|uniref:Hexosyltransferase n=1 Tax=Spirodela intermedia TaxID=51605 RepID=A0ABN7ECU3_SPIIN|nr:unnamed protein product [Spirodela intermedia]
MAVSPTSTTNPSSLFIISFVFLILFSSSSYPRPLRPAAPPPRRFPGGPAFRNAEDCTAGDAVHIAMTLDSNYLRGTMAVVLSVLQHTSCPANIAFHFLPAPTANPLRALPRRLPYLIFHVHRFDSAEFAAASLAPSASPRPAAQLRAHLPRRRVAAGSAASYLPRLGRGGGGRYQGPVGRGPAGRVVAAPEYCHANFTEYFTEAFWGDPACEDLQGRRPCYFNTGVMVMDVERWRRGGYTRMVKTGWRCRRGRGYPAGVVAAFLLGWPGNRGRDNVEGRCRDLHPGPVSLLHWSARGSPGLGWTPGSRVPLTNCGHPTIFTSPRLLHLSWKIEPSPSSSSSSSLLSCELERDRGRAEAKDDICERETAWRER